MIALICFIASCESNQSNSRVQEGITGITSRAIDTSLSNFRIWLRDTLHVANIQNKEGMNSGDIVVGPDSAVLVIKKRYVVVNRSIDRNDSIQEGVLELLEKYREVPEGVFTLNFVHVFTFSESAIPNSIYDLNTGIEDLVLVEEDGRKVNKYSYMRGRLSGKKVTTTIDNGESLTKRVTFTWREGKLEKQQEE